MTFLRWLERCPLRAPSREPPRPVGQGRVRSIAPAEARNRVDAVQVPGVPAAGCGVSTEYRLSGDVTVTRWWNHGAFRWSLHDPHLDALQIAELFNLLDPVVGAALLSEVRRRERDEVQG